MKETKNLTSYPDSRGWFLNFGGRFVPETLFEPIRELEAAYERYKLDSAFQEELAHL